MWAGALRQWPTAGQTGSQHAEAWHSRLKADQDGQPVAGRTLQKLLDTLLGKHGLMRRFIRSQAHKLQGGRIPAFMLLWWSALLAAKCGACAICLTLKGGAAKAELQAAACAL